MSPLRKLAVIAVAFGSVSVAQADPILLGSTELNISASGSLNTISGTGGNADSPISLVDGSTLDFFELVISSFESDVLEYLPQSLTMEWWETGGNPVVLPMINDRRPVEIGQSFTISPATDSAVYNVLLGYINGENGSAGSMPSFSSTMSWGDGGIDASVSLSWTLFAFGSAPASVPEPSTLALFGIGLAGMGLARRRKHLS